ncbi:hypothetical protein M501DRAFT_1001758 [Patellaria atrata CBS 101060]|uniref:RRM domain-containing protein n=1 Tax=Patellaria atrata CBS 101060 TaxID=1346257 RepID=A0A9P4SDH5_9PEZI|nr:hypothetical protein M501DRAFT_1001758 [Patellaria atrata CBS 101060]
MSGAIVGLIKDKKHSKKRPADVLIEEREAKIGNGVEEAQPSSKKAKKTKKSAPEDKVEVEAKDINGAAKTQPNGRKAKKSKKTVPEEVVVVAEEVVVKQPRKERKKTSAAEIEDEKITALSNGATKEADVEDEEEDEIDDQTAALLKGFETDSDEDKGEVQNPDADAVAIDKVPDIPSSKKLRKKLDAVSSDEEPGVIYIGRIPHGFYEHQMRAYFSQFGEILRLRLSRNKKTGRSKHYAFVEFANLSVAKIVADTMNKYLLFGHILQVRMIPKDQVHPELFKNANRRFKTIPRAKIEGRKLRLGMEREGWEKRVQRESERRQKKAEKLKEFGYEFDAPTPKGVDTVPVREQKSLENGGDVKSITEAPEIIEDVVNEPETKRARKPRRAKAEAKSITEAPKVVEEVVTKVVSEPDAVTVAEVKSSKKEKNASKGKKEEAPKVAEETTQVEEVTKDGKTKRTKKSKKVVA